MARGHIGAGSVFLVATDEQKELAQYAAPAVTARTKQIASSAPTAPMASTSMLACNAVAVAIAYASLGVLSAKASGCHGRRCGIFVGDLKDYCKGRLLLRATGTSLALQAPRLRCIVLTQLRHLWHNGAAQ